MTKRELAMIAAAGITLLIVLFLALRRRRARKVDPEYFMSRWKELQKQCVSRKTWPNAIIEADDLLDDALKRRGHKGKTTGERLVSAQHELSSNSSVWFGHKLRNRIGSQDVRKLKKADVLNALSGFREALRDLGALRRD